MKINSIPKSMTIIDNQLVAEMSDLEERSIKSEAIIITSIMRDRPEEFSNVRSLESIGSLGREKLWKLIWIYLRQGNRIEGMGDEHTDMLLNPLYFIRSKITQCEKRTLSQSILDECIRLRTVE